jgi:SUKH-4 immunity protein
MIDNQSLQEIADYWQSEGVTCDKASLPSQLDESDLGKLWQLVGMPNQGWWLFRFTSPQSISAERVKVGTIGENWALWWNGLNGECFVIDEARQERFANLSVLAFAKCLIAFDRGCKRIQRECGSDSGEDWDRGDLIVSEMRREMTALDPRAMEDSSSLWPYLLVDING